MHDAVGIDCSDDEALNTEGHDEEVSRWEQEQIRKGISIPQVSSVNPHPTPSNCILLFSYIVSRIHFCSARKLQG